MENLLSKEEMNAVINGDHGNVFAVLGIHRDKGSKEVFIRTYQPNTKSVELLKKDVSIRLTSGKLKILHINSVLKMIRGRSTNLKMLIVSPLFSAILTSIFWLKAIILICIKNSARTSQKWTAFAVLVLPFGHRMPNVFPWSEISIIGMAALMLCASIRPAAYGIFLFRG